MILEEKTEDATFAEVIRETSTEAFATPQNLPALSSAGNLTASPTTDDALPPAWEKNYTNLDQFSDTKTAKAAIADITKRCRAIEPLSLGVNKKLWLTVAEAIVIFHLTKQSTIDAVCSQANIKPPNKRGNGKRPNRHFVRLVTGRFDDPGFTDEARNTNNKEVGRYARYFDKGLDTLEANPAEFHDDPVAKLYAVIEAHNGLERFVKGDEVEAEENDGNQPLSQTQSKGTNTTSKVTTASMSPMVSGSSKKAEGNDNSENEQNRDDDEIEGSPFIRSENVKEDEKPDKPDVARNKRIWLQAWTKQADASPNVQAVTLTNPPADLLDQDVVLVGRHCQGELRIWRVSNAHQFGLDVIWRMATESPDFAPDLVKAFADLANTQLFPPDLLDKWWDHQAETISSSRLTMVSHDTFSLTSPKSPSCVFTICRLKKPVTTCTRFPLALRNEHFEELTLWSRRDIGQCIAEDSLRHETNGSCRLDIEWCGRKNILSFEPLPEAGSQLNFDFDSFAPELLAMVTSKELSGLHHGVLEPWIEAFGKRQLAKRDNVNIVKLHLDSQFGIEFNISGSGGSRKNFDMETTEMPAHTLSLEFYYDDVLPVLLFLATKHSLNVSIAANYDGIAFYADLGYADFKIYVPALKGNKRRDVLFTQFP